MTTLLIIVAVLAGTVLVVKVGTNLLSRHFERTADTPEEAAAHRDMRENPPGHKVVPDGSEVSQGYTTYN